MLGINGLPIELLEIIFAWSCYNGPQPLTLQGIDRVSIVKRQRQRYCERAVCKKWLAISKTNSCLDITTFQQLETAITGSHHRAEEVLHLHIALLVEYLAMRHTVREIKGLTRQLFDLLQGQPLRSIQIDQLFELHSGLVSDEPSAQINWRHEALIHFSLGMVADAGFVNLERLEVNIGCGETMGTDSPTCDLYK